MCSGMCSLLATSLKYSKYTTDSFESKDTFPISCTIQLPLTTGLEENDHKNC